MVGGGAGMPHASVEQTIGNAVSVAMRNASDRAFFSPSIDILRREFENALNAMRREFMDMSQGFVHRDILTASLHEVKNQAKTDVVTLQSDLEASVVKAGYLSIAVTDCSQEERMQVFAMLKRREAELLGQPALANPGSISSLKDFRFLGAGDLPPPSRPSLGGVGEETIHLQRRPGSKLGLSLDGASGKTLLVEKISPDGDVAAWNAQYPTRAVRQGDQIVAVNNVRDIPARMIEQTAMSDSNGIVVITFIRGGATGELVVSPEAPSIHPSPEAPMLQPASEVLAQAPESQSPSQEVNATLEAVGNYSVELPEVPPEPIPEAPQEESPPEPIPEVPQVPEPAPVTEAPVIEEKVANTINIKVFIGGGKKMGIGLDSHDGKTLKITKILDGLIKEWNEANPDTLVEVGDHILTINGVGDHSNVLVDQIKKGGEIQCIIDKTRY
jgi:hypothetical protein